MEIAGNEIHNENREIRQKSLRTKEKCRSVPKVPTREQ